MYAVLMTRCSSALQHYNRRPRPLVVYARATTRMRVKPRRFGSALPGAA
jgi:hypothetical protein